jgi:capsular exopolysaccharide synthesis family protein
MKGKTSTFKDQDSNVFKLLIFRYYPYWPLFLALSVFTISIGAVYLQIANPVYEVSATLLLKDESKGVEGSRMIESLNILSSKKIVENEIEVIRSRALINETISQLHLTAEIFEDGFLNSHPAYITSPIAIEVRNFTEIVEANKIELHFNDYANLVYFDHNEYPLNTWTITPYGEIRFIENPFLKEIGEGPFFATFIDSRKIVTRILNNLLVLPSNKLSSIIYLTLKDPVPTRGENILNSLVASYAKGAVNDRNISASNTLEFVENRIKMVEQELDSLERSIENYKSAKGVVDLSEQGKVFLRNVGDNDQKLSELDMQTAVLDRVEEYVLNKDNTSKIVPSALGISDPKLSDIVVRLYEAELKYEGLRMTTAENNPILSSLRKEIESMRPTVLENIRNQKQSLIASRQNLSETNSKYASLLETIPTKERELLEASRQQAFKNSVYTFLLQKREEAALSNASSEGDSKIVDKAEASVLPISPKKKYVFGGALILAVLLGIGWIAAKEKFSSNILFRSEIESSTKIPLAGEISFSSLKDYIAVGHNDYGAISEQVRQLRTAIGLYGNSTRKIMMVTSSVAGEGKSFISLNFAVSLAQSGKRVLLLDFDLRNPRLSRFFNATGVSGVSEYFNGLAEIKVLIRRTKIPNVFFMGAGRNLDNAPELLLNADPNNLFTKIHQLFDYIIVDTAPVGPVSDAFLISPYCDATLFVVRHGKTPKSAILMLNENGKVRSLKNVSIVFNAVKPRGFVRNVNGYGYGYGYSYGYGYGKKDKQESVFR